MSRNIAVTFSLVHLATIEQLQYCRCKLVGSEKKKRDGKRDIEMGEGRERERWEEGGREMGVGS